MRVCALVPAYNEEGTVTEVVRGVLRHVPEVLVVDDGSSDRTAELAVEAGATVVRLALNHGKGKAIRTGLSRLLSGTYTHILFMDADRQHDPDDIPRLLVQARSAGADVVIAERVFDKRHMPRARYYSNVIGSWILSSFIGTEIRDSQSGFRLIRADLLRRVALSASGYEIETEMLIKLRRLGARIDRIPVRARYEGAKSKLKPFRDTFKTSMLALWYRFLAR